MKATFNLVDDPWLPCIQADGTPIELGIREALTRAHTLREIYGETPLVTAALHRLLLAILHRVFGPDSRKAWKTLWQAGRWDPDALDAYLDQWWSRFDLFDAEHPFYQTPDPPGNPRPVSALAFELALGNNATLFDHTLDSSRLTLTASYAARLVATVQAFHLAGLAGPGSPNFTDSPWARGVIFLIQGNTLFETLAFNVVRYTDETPIPSQAKDRPAWEQDNPLQPQRGIPFGYLDYLTWQSRQVKLLSEASNGQVLIKGAWIGQGLKLEPQMAELDPMKAYRQHPKRGWLPLRFNENRALWRDSDTLFRLSEDEVRSPAAFRWMAALVSRGLLQPSSMYRYAGLGMANDKAKIHFFQHERMPLPLALLANEDLVGCLCDGLQAAEAGGTALRRAAWQLAAWLVSPTNLSQANRDDTQLAFDQLNPTRRYWSRLEVPFRQFVEDLPHDADGALAAWRAMLLRTARAAFEEAASGVGDPLRGFKAVALARGRLERGLADIRPTEPTPAEQT